MLQNANNRIEHEQDGAVMYLLSQILLVVVASVAAFFILRWMATRSGVATYHEPRRWRRPRTWQSGGASDGDVTGKPVRPKERPPTLSAAAAATPEREPTNVTLRGRPMREQTHGHDEDRKAS